MSLKVMIAISSTVRGCTNTEDTADTGIWQPKLRQKSKVVCWYISTKLNRGKLFVSV